MSPSPLAQSDTINLSKLNGAKDVWLGINLSSTACGRGCPSPEQSSASVSRFTLHCSQGSYGVRYLTLSLSISTSEPSSPGNMLFLDFEQLGMPQAADRIPSILRAQGTDSLGLPWTHDSLNIRHFNAVQPWRREFIRIPTVKGLGNKRIFHPIPRSTIMPPRGIPPCRGSMEPGVDHPFAASMHNIFLVKSHSGIHLLVAPSGYCKSSLTIRTGAPPNYIVWAPATAKPMEGDKFQRPSRRDVGPLDDEDVVGEAYWTGSRDINVIVEF